ncbi:MAG: DUF2147 domain-containing protein [Gammaproteobacteria bacterium]|nr:DUF2147 domain-containing protein [Gammaproteobacteria bacterium]
MNPLQRIAILTGLLLPLVGWPLTIDVEGRWLSGDGDGWIEIELVGDSLIGRIAGSPNDKPDDEPRFDDLNPDPALRDRPLKGMTIMTGFRYEGDGRWVGGRIYDPNSGKTYKGSIRQVDANTLKLRGYIGISLFGRTDTWTRDDE